MLGVRKTDWGDRLLACPPHISSCSEVESMEKQAEPIRIPTRMGFEITHSKPCLPIVDDLEERLDGASAKNTFVGFKVISPFR